MQLSRYLLQRQLCRVQPGGSTLLSFPQRLLKSQIKAVPTQSGQISEDFDALLKKLSSSKKVEETNRPVVIKQKDDVVYIADPSSDWRYWSPIRIGGEQGALSLTISLQKDQAIGLLLKKYNA